MASLNRLLIPFLHTGAVFVALARVKHHKLQHSPHSNSFPDTFLFFHAQAPLTPDRAEKMVTL